MGPSLVIVSTSCYRDYPYRNLLLSRLPLVIGTITCYRNYLLLSRLPLLIWTTSSYRKHLLLSRLPLVIENTSCYRDYLLLLRLHLVIETTSCYRKHLLLSRLLLFVGNTSCYRKAFLSDSEPVIFKEFISSFFDKHWHFHNIIFLSLSGRLCISVYKW